MKKKGMQEKETMEGCGIGSDATPVTQNPVCTPSIAGRLGGM